MALGGYIFRGYQCAKGSLTDAQWALLIHKTRTKAFIDASTAAGSLWAFDKTSGDISLGDHGDVIYSIDSSGCNFISFFKYGEESRYFAVVSMFNQTVSFNYDARSGFGSNGQSNIWASPRTCFHVASLDELTSVDFMLSGNDYPAHALSMYPVTTVNVGSGTNLATTSTSNTLFKESKLYFGYAIKGKEITSCTATGTNSPSGLTPYIYKQCFGYDSMSMSSPNDNYNIFAASLDAWGSNENENSNWTGTSTDITGSYCNLTLKDTGGRYNAYNVAYPDLQLSYNVFKAIFSNNPTVMPYESVILAARNNRTEAPFLNADGVASKGTMDIEFMAMNGSCDYFSNRFSKNSPQSQGNYLAANYNNSSLYSPNSCCYYVGWDPGNPDLLTEDAWAAYDGT